MIIGGRSRRCQERDSFFSKNDIHRGRNKKRNEREADLVMGSGVSRPSFISCAQ